MRKPYSFPIPYFPFPIYTVQMNGDITTMSLEQRLDYFSNQFLGLPYCAGALGEGPDGQYDQNPLYRFDAFDCLTYVNTVLALSLANESLDYEQLMLRLNYYDAEPCYLKRYHFMSVDWNLMNQQAGFIKDITTTICNPSGDRLYKTATAFIDKPQWFKHQGIPKAIAEQFTPQQAQIDFLPLDLSYDKQIPNASIIEIVRSNWDLRDKIGTELLVSHLGFVFRRDQQLLLRHASSLQKQVVEVPLRDYLEQQRAVASIVGINIQKIMP